MSEDDLALLEERLSDPLWRLTSGELYKIKTADGRGIIPFIPRPEQVELLKELVEAVYAVKTRSLAIAEGGVNPDNVPPVGCKKCKLKSRRLGFSTTLGVFVADCLGFIKGFTATLIDQTQKDDASKKMNGIVKVAMNSLRAVWPLKLIKDNDSELSVAFDFELKEGDKGESTFYATTKARGGSNDFLWISEWGAIQYDDPPRSSEIRSGALPSARHGVTFVETTWKGGKGGDLWDIIEPTLTGKANDWSVSFTPWWIDPRNASTTAQHDEHSLAYFASIEKRLKDEGITLTDAQRRWWAAERREQGRYMKRENPTFLSECWEVPVDGAIYADEMNKALTQGRIGLFPIDGRAPVHTSWDLGSSLHTVVWYWQRLPGGITRFIDIDYALDVKMPERAAMMKAKGYAYGKHYLPHDSKQERLGSSFLEEFTKLAKEVGLGDVVRVPMIPSTWLGVDYVGQLFASFEFRKPACDKGIAGLEAYRRQKNTSDGVVRDEPVHDWASHIADAVRTMAEADKAGLISSARNNGATVHRPQPAAITGSRMW